MPNEVTVRAMMMPMENLEKLAAAVSKTRMWKGIDTPEKALSLMMLCQAEGLHPMQAVRRYDIIDGGAPTLKAEALLAEFYDRGGRVKWLQRTTEVCEGIFSHPRTYPEGATFKWTIADAQKAGLAGKFNWKSYPRQMLCARVISEAIQVVDPGTGLGMQTTEEMVDIRNHMADSAAEISSGLTGQNESEIESGDPLQTLPPKEDKDWKKLRAELNKTLKACATLQAFRDACKTFQTANGGKAIWLERTRHNRQIQSEAGLHDETFGDLAQDHQNRLTQAAWFEGPEGVKTWIEKMKGSSLADFPGYIKSFRNEARLQTHEVEDALHEKALNLGLQSFADVEGEDNEVYEATE